MKRIIGILLVGLIAFSGYSQKYGFEKNFKSKKLDALSGLKVYVGLTGDEELDNALREGVEAYWDFNKIAGEKNADALRKDIKSGKKVAFISLSTEGYSSRSGVKSFTRTLVLNTSGGKYSDYLQHICYAEGFDVNTSVGLAIKIMNGKLKMMKKSKVKSSAKLKDVAISHKSTFAKKTLYIPREWLDGISESEFKDSYTGKVKFVSVEEYIADIKAEKSDMIYALPMAVPAEGGFVNTHIFIDAEGTGYLGLAQRMPAGAFIGGNFGAYKGTINARFAKLYEKTSQGNW